MGVIKHIILYIQYLVRYPFFKLRHNTLSYNSRIMPHVCIRNTEIGDFCHIGSYCDISYAKIGNYSCIANGVVVGGMEHPHWDLSISPKLSGEYVYGRETIIGHDVWIASCCIIKQGVKIGDGAVIGANSFVNTDVPPYAIVFGTPAKIFKYRDCQKLEKILLQSEYWTKAPYEARKIIKRIKNGEKN